MDHVFFEVYGWILALSAFLFGVAHSIVVTSPPHPDFAFLRSIIRGRELVLVPLSILVISLPNLFGAYQLGALSMITSISLLLTLFLLGITPQLRRVMTDRVKEINLTYSAPHRDSPYEQKSASPYAAESISADIQLPEAGIGNVLEELRDQRRVQQVIWDLPVGIVLVDQEYRIQSRVGGLTRSRSFPTDLVELGTTIPERSSYRLAAQAVYRSHERTCFEAINGEKQLQVCVSPWVSMSGKVRGVTFLITAFHDRMMTDEGEVRYHA